MEHSKPEKVQFIVNPAPAKRVSLLATMNSHFREAGIRWDVSLTHGEGDGREMARRALENGADVVGVYGGDGTVAEVASALIGQKTPLLILPGGTGNLVASELRIGNNLDKICKKICGETYQTREIDVGEMGEHIFLLRIGCGLEPGVVQDATREMKNQFGKWAYVFAGIKRLQEHPVAEYEISLNGRETFSASGVACIVANAGTVGLGRLTLSPRIDVDDGKLDLIFVKKANIEGIVQMAVQMMGLPGGQPEEVEPGLDASRLVNHWRIESAEIRTDPELDIQVDGDVVARTPQLIRVRPSDLTVVV